MDLRDIEQRLSGVEKALSNLGVSLSESLGSWEKLPAATCIHTGVVVEHILRDLWKRLKLKGSPERRQLEDLLTNTARKMEENNTPIPRRIHDHIRILQLTRNRAAHHWEANREDAVDCLQKLADVAHWYFIAFLPTQEPTSEESEAAAAGRGEEKVVAPSAPLVVEPRAERFWPEIPEPRLSEEPKPAKETPPPRQEVPRRQVEPVIEPASRPSQPLLSNEQQPLAPAARTLQSEPRRTGLLTGTQWIGTLFIGGVCGATLGLILTYVCAIATLLGPDFVGSFLAFAYLAGGVLGAIGGPLGLGMAKAGFRATTRALWEAWLGVIGLLLPIAVFNPADRAHDYQEVWPFLTLFVASMAAVLAFYGASLKWIQQKLPIWHVVSIGTGAFIGGDLAAMVVFFSVGWPPTNGSVRVAPLLFLAAAVPGAALGLLITIVTRSGQAAAIRALIGATLGMAGGLPLSGMLGFTTTVHGTKEEIMSAFFYCLICLGPLLAIAGAFIGLLSTPRKRMKAPPHIDTPQS